MIRPLRRRHLWLVAAVAAVAGPLYLAALAARPAPAVRESLPEGIAERVAPAAGAETKLPTTPPLRVRAAGAGRIELSADGFVEGADLLLYWAPGEGARDLADAWLLGAVRGGERQLLALPQAAAGRSGFLVLYSLGHGAEVASAPWPSGGAAAP